jgi:hypothetical protein
MESALSDVARRMREPHYRRGQDCSDVIGLPVSGRRCTTQMAGKRPSEQGRLPTALQLHLSLFGDL